MVTEKKVRTGSRKREIEIEIEIERTKISNMNYSKKYYTFIIMWKCMNLIRK